MKWFNNLKIKTKILIGSMLLSLFSVFLGFIGYYSMNNMMENQIEIVDVRLPSVESLLIMSEAQTAVIAGERGLLNNDWTEDDIRNAQYDYIDSAFKRAKDAWKIYAPLPQTEEESKLWKKFVPEWLQWEKEINIIVNLSKEKDKLIDSGIAINDIKIQQINERISQQSFDSRESFLKAETTLNKIININEKIIEYESNNGRITHIRGKNIIIITIVIGLLISIIISIFISTIISKPIVNTTLLLKDISEGDGDLTKRLEVKSKDEIGQLSQYFNSFVDRIFKLILQVKDNADSLKGSSNGLSSVSEELLSSTENITNAINDVAKGAGEQAKDLTNITNILDNFSEKLGHIVDIISDIDTGANEIQSMADNSGNEMQILIQSINKVTNSFNDFVDQISNLGENINQINQITNVINTISDQTNLLALNASIEAARAGEAGKGFSVVAEEIRKLAEQSKSSAKNINSLIDGISKDTNTMLKTTNIMDEELNNQVTIINSTIDSFKKIINGVNDVIPKIEEVNTDAVNIDNEKDIILEKIQSSSSVAEEVSASSEEIAASSEQINASTEDMVSSVHALSDVTTNLMEQINKFKL